jgi:hypothetical protein
VVEFVIGDVHGCYNELMALEDLIKERCAAEGISDSQIHFVLCGDLIDRGPNISEVLRHVQAGVTAGTHSCVCGNHESILLELVDFFARGPLRWSLRNSHCFVSFADKIGIPNGNPTATAMKEFQTWLAQGGAPTLGALGLGDDPLGWELQESSAMDTLRWLAELPLVYQSTAVSVSHALATAANFAWAKDQTVSTSSRMSGAAEAKGTQHTSKTSDHLDGLLWARTAAEPWMPQGPIHVSGHTPLDTPRWLEDGRRLMIDTGCVYGNTLSAWSPQLDAVLSVPFQS